MSWDFDDYVESFSLCLGFPPRPLIFAPDLKRVNWSWSKEEAEIVMQQPEGHVCVSVCVRVSACQSKLKWSTL